MPIGLINGNTHCGGTRPPFRPRQVVTALRRLLEEPSVGDRTHRHRRQADVPHRLRRRGDIGALLAGDGVTLRL